MTSLENAAKVLPKGTLDALAAAGYSGVPLTATLFSPLNLFVTLGLLALVPISLAFLSPRNPADMQDPPPWQLTSQPQFGEAQLPDPLHPPGVARRRTFADFLDSSPLASLLLVVLLVLALIRFSRSRSFFDTGLNEVNMAMLALGLVLHGSPRRYLAAVEDGARGCAGIILQFPLYAGIAAMMVVSGLASQIARGIAETGGPGLLPLLTFFAAAVINVFIPSGGGQWGVQGPIALESGLAAGIDPGVMTMAVAYGDQLTNMLQPFWALPLLAITGARARDIVGYTAIVMIAGGVWISLGMLVF
jgi:short-chain fatty acids transporter